MTLTDQELADLERLHQAATPGEWHVEAEPEDMQSWYICHPATVCTVTTVCQIENEGDAAAIVAAHNALPALIAEVRRLRDHVANAGKMVPPDHIAGAGKAIAQQADTPLATRNDVLEEAARVADKAADVVGALVGPSGTSDVRAAAHLGAEHIAAAIRALKDASLPDYSGGGL